MEMQISCEIVIRGELQWETLFNQVFVMTTQDSHVLANREQGYSHVTLHLWSSFVILLKKKKKKHLLITQFQSRDTLSLSFTFDDDV